MSYVSFRIMFTIIDSVTRPSVEGGLWRQMKSQVKVEADVSKTTILPIEVRQLHMTAVSERVGNAPLYTSKDPPASSDSVPRYDHHSATDITGKNCEMQVSLWYILSICVFSPLKVLSYTGEAVLPCL